MHICIYVFAYTYTYNVCVYIISIYNIYIYIYYGQILKSKVTDHLAFEKALATWPVCLET